MVCIANDPGARLREPDHRAFVPTLAENLAAAGGHAGLTGAPSTNERPKGQQ